MEMEKVPWAVETASLSPQLLLENSSLRQYRLVWRIYYEPLPDHSARYILANAYSESLSSEFERERERRVN